jgi:hypothetical protein
MIEKYITYDNNGRILVLAQTLTENLPINSMEVDDFDESKLNTHYIDLSDSIIKERPIQNTTLDKTRINADGIDFITISNTPIESYFYSVLYDIKAVALSYEVSGIIDGIDTFSTTIPGKYIVRIEAFPYLDFETTIEAT